MRKCIEEYEKNGSFIKDVKLGKNVKIVHPVNLYGCEIGDDTKIDAFTYIEGGVKIGKKCKIRTHVFIPEGVTIEDQVFIGPCVCFTNDKYPRATNPNGSMKIENDWVLLKTLIKRGAVIGAKSVVLPGISIGEYAVVGAGSVVTKDVPPYKTVVGNPARVVGDVYDLEVLLKFKGDQGK